MPNGTYGGVRGRKTKVGRKLLRFPPTRFYTFTPHRTHCKADLTHCRSIIAVLKIIIIFATSLKDDYRNRGRHLSLKDACLYFKTYRGEVLRRGANCSYKL